MYWNIMASAVNVRPDLVKLLATSVGENEPQGTFLTRESVDAMDNGTLFTCYHDLGSLIRTANYTLRVAYGPVSDDVSITTSRPINSTDHQPVTFTCMANNTYPTPSFLWEGVQCQEGGTGPLCTFDPSLLTHNITVVRCNVSSVNDWNTAFAEYVLHGHTHGTNEATGPENSTNSQTTKPEEDDDDGT
ncbi:uncharacterized protein LOC143276698 [Babylonia areolata]|uniref:uncharacterized protein LOC143276698 n=1 Tax=Babylonia areolata TaxID=304850 RepID=UPI003FD0FEE0